MKPQHGPTALHQKRICPPRFSRPVYIIFLLLLLSSGLAAANESSTHNSILADIVSEIVVIMRANGHEVPNYQVTSGHTDVPISGPPEKYAFFGYIKKGWFHRSESIALHFYEADKLPILGRLQVIEYLVMLCETEKDPIKISLYMTEEKYRKPQIIFPPTFLEMHINNIRAH